MTPLLVVLLLFVAAVQGAAIVFLVMGSRSRARVASTASEAAKRFRVMVDGAPVMLWSARPDATLDFVNQTCAKVSGLPIEQLLDDGWLSCVHPDDLGPIRDRYVPAMSAGLPFQLEYRVRVADGSWRWLLSIAAPQHAADGSHVGYVGCDVDISERKKAEERIRQSEAVLEASHREIQHLAGRLLTAHEDERRRLARELHDDLTQRLASLAVQAGNLERSAGAAAAAMRVSLARLSEDVHAMSYRLHPSVLDDLGLVEALRAECDRVAHGGHVRVEVQAHDVPRRVSSETSLCLFRVAQEAINNATRHGRASSVTVQLTPHERGLQLAVADNGSGFDPDRPRESASLGLASMRERVRLLRGVLDIESTPGHGTKVTAWVPA